VKAIDTYLAAQVGLAGRVGLSVAIVRDGQVVLEKGYGKRSLADGRPVDAGTLFAIGSVTKQFTCACVLLLAEDGKLSVHDPVAKYYPSLTRAKDITLLDLMNHVSGYPDYYPLDFVDRRMRQPIAEEELLRRYAGGKLDFEPGAKYSYSNTGYILLGRVVEKVSGLGFGEFLARRIFKPLGLAQTVYEPASGDPRLASGYSTFALSAPEPAEPEARGWIGAAGGIHSTPGDLARWDLALIGGKLLKPESLALMTTPRKLRDGKVSDYGCGLSLKNPGGRPYLSHNGAVSGFNASNVVIPSTRSAVILLANLDGGLGALPGQVLSLLLKEPAFLPGVAGPGAAETARALFVGLQSGKVDRKRLGEEFNLFLTDDRIAGAGGRLKRYGAPVRADVVSLHERGGMEVSTTRLTFRTGALRTLMYRQPDGRVEQFFVSPD
jgi:CubicO group peptidase (beta-lactamase class C family)